MKVSERGEVTAVAKGVVNVVVKTVDGGKEAGCRVTVLAPTVAVSGVALSKAVLPLTIGAKETLVATVSPANATNKSVTWSSSMPGVAKVSTSGEVTGVATGTAIITVTSADGGKTAVCEVTVTRPVVPAASVTLDRNTLALSIGNKRTLIATVAPENATDKSVSWSSSAPSVASVSNSGEVMGVSVGTSTVTVTTSDGNKAAVCEVAIVSSGPKTGDYYYSDGTYSSSLNRSKTCTGVVFWVDPENPSKGKIVCLDEPEAGWNGGVNYPGSLQWSTERVFVNATSDTDGAANTDKIRRLASYSVSVYPAVAWCVSKGGSWYLPAKEEVIALRSAMIPVNQALLRIPAKELLTGYHWTSTEGEGAAAWSVLFSPEAASCNGKGNSGRIRAVSAF